MAVAGQGGNNQTFPLVCREFILTGLTGAAKNSVVLTGFSPNFVINGAFVFPLGTGTTLTGCCYDPDPTTFIKDPTDPTQVLIDIYPGGNITSVRVIVY